MLVCLSPSPMLAPRCAVTSKSVSAFQNPFCCRTAVRRFTVSFLKMIFVFCPATASAHSAHRRACAPRRWPLARAAPPKCPTPLGPSPSVYSLRWWCVELLLQYFDNKPKPTLLGMLLGMLVERAARSLGSAGLWPACSVSAARPEQRSCAGIDWGRRAVAAAPCGRALAGRAAGRVGGAPAHIGLQAGSPRIAECTQRVAG